MKSGLLLLLLGLGLPGVGLADGAYRTADDDGFTYMLLFNVRKSRK